MGLCSLGLEMVQPKGLEPIQAVRPLIKSQLLCRSSSDCIIMIIFNKILSNLQKLVVSKGIEPLSIAYQARALPLSYETNDFETLNLWDLLVILTHIHVVSFYPYHNSGVLGICHKFGAIGEIRTHDGYYTTD
jgi:hypothetical protein